MDCNYGEYEINFVYFERVEVDLSDYVLKRSRADHPKVTEKSSGEGEFLSATVHKKTPIPGHTVRG